jgi:hypothetical protein
MSLHSSKETMIYAIASHNAGIETGINISQGPDILLGKRLWTWRNTDCKMN